MSKIWAVSVSYGELILKGKNRCAFIRNAERQMRKALREVDVLDAYSELGKRFVEVDEKDLEHTVAQLKKVFGLVYVTPSVKTEAELQAVAEQAEWLVARKLDSLKREQPQKETFTFKVVTKRSNKAFPMNSTAFSQALGGLLLDRCPHLAVDLHAPDFYVHVELRSHAFVFIDREKGMGGLPWGSAGRGLLLLSGGIDSPVAGFEIAKRGLALGAVHFHSYPFTSERAQDKTVRLAQQMSAYTGPMNLYMVNLREVYTAINQHCRARNTTVLSRRMMMRICDAIADSYDYDAFVTGESLGQVASQTLQGISVVDKAAQRAVLRPLIATDKVDIIESARMIGTYEISIEPFDDCCSIFAPTRPNTKPRAYDMENEELALDIPALIEQAMSTLETIKIQ